MRFSLFLFSLLAVFSVSVTAQDSFCVKYTKQLFQTQSRLNNYKLLNAVVARVTVGCNTAGNAFGVANVANTPYAAYAAMACNANANGITAVPGLVQDPLNAPFFAGTAPAFQSFTNASKLNTFAGVNTAGLTSIPFVQVNGKVVTPLAAALGGNVAAGVMSEGLITHLISFFGIALGCDVDMTQNTNIQPATAFIGRYNGVVSMTAVHQGMAINWAVWNEFANTFILSLKSFGVTQADIDGTIVPYLNSFLRGPAGSTNVICNQADCPCAPQFQTLNGQCVAVPPTPPTFCQKYAAALFKTSTPATQYALLNAVVARVTVGCNTAGNAFGVANVANGPYAAYAASTCGQNQYGITAVPGLVSDPLNAPFFAGTAPAFQSFTNAAALNKFKNVSTVGLTSIPFVGVNGKVVTPTPATLGGNIAPNMVSEGLITHLISFFGTALGCDINAVQNPVITPTATTVIGRYNGVVNMTAVHVGMAINLAVWNEFANTFVMTLKSFGVLQADIDGTIQPYLNTFLRGPQGSSNVICNQADCPCAPQFQAQGALCVMPPPPTPPTFCQKYSQALFGASNPNTQYNLLNAVVARVTVGCDNNVNNAFGVPGVANSAFAVYSPQSCGPNQYMITQVPGLVADKLNAPFFAGLVPAYPSITGAIALNAAGNVTRTGFPSIRFVGVAGKQVTPFPATTGIGMTEGLIQHLISFFGAALGCDINNQQNTVIAPNAATFIGKYNGVVNMTQVHLGMAINQNVWDEFVRTFTLTLQSFGVAQADIDGTIKPYLAQFLRGPIGSDQVICNTPDCMCAPQFNLNTVTKQCDPKPNTNPPTLPPATPPPTETKQTFCTKYATALFKNLAPAQAEYKLLQSVIARVILGCNNPVTGAFFVPGAAASPELAAFAASRCDGGFQKVSGLVSDPLNGPFFDGTGPDYGSITRAFELNVANNVTQGLPFTSVRFVTVNGINVLPTPAALGGVVPFPKELGMPGGVNVEGLITHLIAFFGRDLGCQSIDTMRDTITTPITKARIGKYNGATSMFQVHQNMKITQAVWDEFANTFISALMSFGVTQEDIDKTIKPYLSLFMRGPANGADMMICNQPDCACGVQFVLFNGQCVDPATITPGGDGAGQLVVPGKKVGQASGLLASPIIVAAVTVMAILFA